MAAGLRSVRTRRLGFTDRFEAGRQSRPLLVGQFAQSAGSGAILHCEAPHDPSC